MDANYGLPLEEIRNRYLALYAGAIYDALSGAGFPNNALSQDIQCVTPGMKLSGFAFTVRGVSTPITTMEQRVLRTELIKEMSFPCIEVRDCVNQNGIAHYGELSAATARAHGAIGALVDGGCRDISLLRKWEYPVFARYRCPVEANGHYAVIDYAVPITMAGTLTEQVPIHQGDWIFGDEDGVLVIPKDLVVEVLQRAEAICKVEDLVREEFMAGGDPTEIYKKYRKI